MSTWSTETKHWMLVGPPGGSALMSVNKVYCAVRKCRIKPHHAKKRPHVNMIQKCHHLLLRPEDWKWAEAKRKTVLWSDTSKFEILFGDYGGCILRTKDEREHPAGYQHISDGMGCISAYHIGSLRICKGHHQCWEAYTGFTATYAPWRCSDNVYFREGLAFFSKTMLNCILKLQRQRGFVVCNMDLSPTENIWCIMKQKIWQRRPRAVEQLESNMRKKWDNIPLPKFQQLLQASNSRLLYFLKLYIFSLSTCRLWSAVNKKIALWDLQITFFHQLFLNWGCGCAALNSRSSAVLHQIMNVAEV